ncbi:hypothetical protein FS837_008260 [Tulasnella sp. UAMH 9824]|nr:hypothetical protein FS837_008260 [Tulasnella sp. UAMH 9824]
MQVAFDIWQYQPNEKNREEAELFGRACPESDGKWGVMDDVKFRRPGSLGANFLEGYQCASEYLTAGDADEFALQVALLHALAVTDDKPIEAYGWSKLKNLVTDLYPDSDILVSLSAVLIHKGLGKSNPVHADFDKVEWKARAKNAYQREQLGMNLVLALASAVHAVKHVLPSQLRVEMVEICTIYIRMARNLADLHGAKSPILEQLGKSVADLMMHVYHLNIWNPHDVPWAEFSVEAVLSLQDLKSLKGVMKTSSISILPALWHAFDSIITTLKSARSIQGLGPNFVLDALEWLSKSLPEDDPMTGLEGDHAVLRYIASGLSDRAPRQRQRWIQLFLKNKRRWFEQAPRVLCHRWLDVGLGVHLLEIFKRPTTWGKSDTGIVDILESTLLGPSNFGLYLLGSAPFIAASAHVISYLDEARGSVSSSWRVVLRKVLAILLGLWKCTAGLPGMASGLTVEMMLPALRGATALLNWEMSHQMGRQRPQYADDLYNFIMILKRQLPSSALMARNVDVTVNTLQGELEVPTHSRVKWKYQLYGSSRSRTICTRTGYLDDGYT